MFFGYPVQSYAGLGFPLTCERLDTKITGAPLHKRMAEALMTADGLQPLVSLLSKDMRRGVSQ